MVIADEVREALERGGAVVALETAVLTHGLPHPHNIEAARACEQAVREAGAVPATTGVLDGEIRVGLNEAEIERLGSLGARASRPPGVAAEGAAVAGAAKLAARDLGAALAGRLTGGATVSATLAIAALAGIRFLSTGGIGGVHRSADGSAPADVSSDLVQLTRSPVVVVCSGAKAVLDLPRTLEYLETLGVPVLGYQTLEFPAFISAESGLPLAHQVDSPEEAARVAAAYRAIGYNGSVVIANPPPTQLALERSRVERAVEIAVAASMAEQMQGPAVTPFLLAELFRATEGESLAVNLALLASNARLAGEIAVSSSKFQVSS
jgi:pseudouridine-5'-phosphate glycosidase